ncbi:GAF domain-containing protein [Curtobacterium aurantiacum]|uniref:GAF domain-containing protein n=1 Tax=Curtobacterium aurantiacum TaxID=3236919 RepID=UPI001BDE1F00|nr:GAF domain-containing protein [Curtobacterium flaccumfaciens]MBT1679369.1 GAF domain-containing protein [Curtobacterium flaccumfaciens pv. flaccumfaciens]
MRAPGRLRPLVAASWQRSARVDPDAAPVLALGADELDAARHDGPIATLLPVVRRLLLDDSRAAGCVVAVGDASGRLVWVDGARSARRAAEDMGFVPGADWAEDRVGTSAPGTALRLDRPVQIRSDEHYANAVKPFSCTAVPVHDASGATIGVLDLTGDDRAVERHTLSLLTATVAAAEAQLALAAARTPSRPPRAPEAAAELTVLGTDTAVLRLADRRVQLSARHSELLVVLAAHPGGLAAPDLATAVYGDPRAVVTLRAEVVRLRRVLARHAPDVTVTSRPYRVTGVRTDVDGVLSALERGARLQAVDRYAGPVLPGSAAPGVDAVRDLVRLRFRESVVADGGVDALLAWARTPDGATDALVLRALLAVLPRRSPRRAGLVAAIEALEGF